MKSLNTLTGKIYTGVFAFIMLVMIIFIVLSSEIFSSGSKSAIRNFSEGWTEETGESRFIRDVRLTEPGQEITLTKKLPGTIAENDCICLETKNSAVTVWVDDRKVYSFVSEENTTGLGYGVYFHEINISDTDGGRMVTIAFSAANPDSKNGSITSVYLAPAADFIHMCVNRLIVPASISLFIIFLGLLMFIIYIRIPDKNDLPFSIIAISLFSILVGVWLFVDTNIMQLVEGNLYLWRGINRYPLLFALYPFLLFINSITKLKRQIYQIIAFYLNLAVIGVAVLLRYVLNVDMSASFTPLVAVEVLILIVVSTVILLDNYLYCRENGVVVGIRSFYYAIIVFAGCTFGDLLMIRFRYFSIESYGSLTRLGILFFVVVFLFEFLKWWTRDRADVQRDRFINKVLQYAVSYSPEDSIRLILEFMGTELKTDRIGIFEKQDNGKFRGTYEWYREDLKEAGMDLLYLPYEGLVEEMNKAFKANHNRLIISSPEEYKTALPSLYSIMVSNDIENMVSCPLDSNGNLIGWLAFIGTPPELQEETAEILSVTSYFLTQLIVQREEQKRLRYYSYNDPLSGALNRRAFSEYIETGLDKSLPFGYMICTIKGLEAANASVGYEAGDRMVVGLVKSLFDVFGEGNVYRMGGAEFSAFGFETDEVFFNSDVERARMIAKDKGLELSVGAVYCAFGTMGMPRVLARASELMKADK